MDKFFLGVILISISHNIFSQEFMGNTFRISDKNIYLKISNYENFKEIKVDIEENIPITKIKNKNGIAFVIGIDKYQDKTIPNVEFAKNDANLMKEYLIKRFGFLEENIYPKEQLYPTAAYLKTFLKDYLKKVLKPDGTSDLFIYFTGHGAPGLSGDSSGYIVPFDANPNYLNDINAYNLNEFFKDISNLNAKNKIVVLDACFSGQAGNGKMLINNASPLLIKPKTDIFYDKNSKIILSSKSNQVSNWYPQKKHSMFTYFFLKALKGDADLNIDGKISLSEISDFINDPNDGLPYHSEKEFQRRQEIQIYGNMDELIIKNQ